MFWKKGNSPKFIATFELGRLSRWLRLIGFDCVYFKKREKRELVIKSLRENRVILTRETGMSRYSGTRMIHIENDLVENQLIQVLKKMRLEPDPAKIFTICTICNRPIQDVKKNDVEKLVPPYVYKTQENFKKCFHCNKIYWKGTHWKLATDFFNSTTQGRITEKMPSTNLTGEILIKLVLDRSH